MSRQYTKIIMVDDPIVGRDLDVVIPRYAEIRLWVEEPERYEYDRDTLRRITNPTGRTDTMPNPFRKHWWQRKTIDLDVYEVHEWCECIAYWTDELLGPQAEQQTVYRTYEWRVPVRGQRVATPLGKVTL